MPNIEFKDLNRQSSIGTELFADTESFLEDLTDDAENIVGGINEGAAIASSRQLEHMPLQTTVYRPEYVTTTVYYPHPGGNSGINYTDFYTTTLYKPHQPPHRHPIYRKFVTNDT